MKNTKMFLGLILLIGILLSACQPAVPTEVPTEVPPPDEEYTYGTDAIVELVEVVLLESFPLQARAIVTGSLPDGCTEIHDITVEREGQEFIITVTTRRPTGDVACTQALVPFQETIALDIEGLEAGTYVVIAQDQQATFTLEVDNEAPQQIDKSEYALGSEATIEEMSVNIMESFPVQVSVTLVGYLPDGCVDIEEIKTSREEQTFTIDVVTRRLTGDVACTMAIVPFEESVSLDVEGLPAGEYTVQAGDLTQTFTLEADN